MRTPFPQSPATSRGLTKLAHAPALLLTFAVLLAASHVQAQAPLNNAPPKLRFERDQHGDFALIGNTLAQDCRSTTPLPLAGRTRYAQAADGTPDKCYQRDTSPDFFWTLDDPILEDSWATARPFRVGDATPSSLDARSRAVLTLPTSAKVTYARLYWAATRFNSNSNNADKITEPDLTVKLSRPGVAGFADRTLTADDYAFQYTTGAEYQYQATADITDIVKGFGPGAYQVSDVLAIPLDTVGGEYIFHGWWMVVFYEETGATKRHLKLFDSMKVVEGTATEVTLNGFYVPPYAVDAKLGVVAFEGDDPAPDINDTLAFNGTLVSNDLNPANNFFNSTRSWTALSPGVRTDTPHAPGLNALPISHSGDRPQLTGTQGSLSGIDVDVVDVTVAAGDKSAQVKVATTGDRFWLGGFVTSITTQAPDFTNTIKSVRNLSRTDGTIRPGDTIEYTISTTNEGDDHSRDTVLTDRIPDALTYVPGSTQVLSVVASDTATPGPRTDVAGDDVADYDAATKTLTLRLGRGATATKGGRVGRGESTSISFQAKVRTDFTGPVDNQGFIEAGGELGIDPVKTPSRSPTGSGPTKIEVVIIPTPVITSPANGSMVTTTTPTYTGTALPGTTVTVKHSDGTTLCTTTADASTGAWSCTGPTPLSEGSHTVNVTAEDSMGNVSKPATTTFTVDTTPPAAPVITSPGSGQTLTTQRPTFTGTAEPGATVIVSLTYEGVVRELGQVTAGPDGKWSLPTFEPLKDGPYTVGAVAKDAAGRTSPATSVPFTIASGAPETTLTSTPPALSSSASATFTFTSATSGAFFECKLDGGTYAPCDSPKTYTGLADGSHTFTVRAKNPSTGNVDLTPETYTWTVRRDTDGDGIPDSTETATGTDPADDDTDNDGLRDGTEDADRDGVVDPGETDPKKEDTDGDGLQDGTELGLTTPEGLHTDMGVFRPDADPGSKTDPLKADTDEGGVSDGVEDKNHNGRVDAGEGNPLNPADDKFFRDTDGDGIPDGTEDKDRDGVVDPGETDPTKPDSDGDGIPDGIEDKDRDGTVDPDETDPTKVDTDGGGVPDGQEDKDKDGVVDPGETDPRNPADDRPTGNEDSDNDGVPDAREREIGLDPNDPDSDDDGVPDGADGLTDTDKDGIIDARDPDSDNDGILDGTELGVTRANAPAGTNVNSPHFVPDDDPSTTTDPKNPDSDGDGLKDGEEDKNHDGRFGAGETDAKDPDTDHGGIPDGDEVKSNSNPLDDTDDFLVFGRGCSTSGGSPLVWLAALLLAVPLMRSRRATRTVAAGGLLGLLGMLSAPAAQAQAPVSSPVSQSIDVQRYKPGPGATDVLGVSGAKVGGHLGWHLGASLNYASNPLGFYDPRQDDFVYQVVANQVTLDLLGSLSLFDRFELGVALPVTYQSSEGGASLKPAFQEGVSGAGVGDLRLVPKAHLLSAGGLELGFTVPVLLPTAGGQGFRGGGGVGVRPQLVAEWATGGGLRLMANMGAHLQREEQLRNLRVGNELAFAVGAQVPLSEKLALQASLAGAHGLTEGDAEEFPLELLAAVQYRLREGLKAHVGGGPGLTRGYGTPGFRVFAGLDWTQPGERAPAAPPPPADADGDGLADAQDKCPSEAEDKDGAEDTDGCPDPDNDQDGIADAQDRCPAEAETRNDFEDADGCPDQAPPPPADTDGDGLTDDQDKCPSVAEDKDGFEDADGCADPDNDKDGVADGEDQCPAQPEVINGVKDDDGCPDEGKSKVRLESKRIVILDKVYFATAKDVILPRSFDLLKQVAAVLRANPQIELLRVEGHTDNQGKPANNQKLSQRRAANVRAFLIREGVAAERLEAVGYGQEKPVDTNKTEAGRENNRRVEFNILKVAGSDEAEKAP